MIFTFISYSLLNSALSVVQSSGVGRNRNPANAESDFGAAARRDDSFTGLILPTADPSTQRRPKPVGHALPSPHARALPMPYGRPLINNASVEPFCYAVVM